MNPEKKNEKGSNNWIEKEKNKIIIIMLKTHADPHAHHHSIFRPDKSQDHTLLNPSSCVWERNSHT